MTAFLDGITGSYPALPQEDVSGELLAPRKGVLKYVSHDNLKKYHTNTDDHATNKEVFLDLAKYIQI